MNPKNMHSQPGLFDYVDHEPKLAQKQTTLDKLNEFIDWEMFRSSIEQKFAKPSKGPGGRPAFDRLLMFKILALQSIYDLSDAETEFQINDRSSFRRFLGLTVSNRIPDEKTIWLFREQLGPEIIQCLMKQFMDFLRNRGVELSSGRIIDATFCESRIQRNTKPENEAIKKGELPDSWKDSSQSRLRQKDTEARWGCRRGKFIFGYKHHITVDQKTKLITGSLASTASMHDSKAFDPLFEPNITDFWADKGYDKGPIRSSLEKHGIRAYISQQRKGNQSKQGEDISEEIIRDEYKWGKVRKRVEHVFGSVKKSLKGYFFRGIGLRRADMYITQKGFAYNLLQGCRLLQKLN